MADHAPDPIVSIDAPEQPFPTAPLSQMHDMQETIDGLRASVNDAWVQFRALRNVVRAAGWTDQQINEHLSPLSPELQAKITQLLAAMAAAGA